WPAVPTIASPAKAGAEEWGSMIGIIRRAVKASGARGLCSPRAGKQAERRGQDRERERHQEQTGLGHHGAEPVHREPGRDEQPEESAEERRPAGAGGARDERDGGG